MNTFIYIKIIIGGRIVSLRVLCVNPYPIASTCPIGYMSEHLFSNEEFEILEYHSVSCDTYKSLSKSYRVSFNKVTVDATSATKIL